LQGTLEGSPLHDAHTVAAMLREDAYTFERMRMRVMVASKGEPAHGAVLIDRRLVESTDRPVDEATVRVATSVDAAQFKQLIISRLASLP
jgi:inosine-uridine nucleoside N-ribohydrolase